MRDNKRSSTNINTINTACKSCCIYLKIIAKVPLHTLYPFWQFAPAWCWAQKTLPLYNAGLTPASFYHKPSEKEIAPCYPQIQLWILWIMWITRWITFQKERRKLSKSRKIKVSRNCQLIFYVNKNIHIVSLHKMLKTMWIMWITYRPRSFSPTFTISPAPIVINKSPGTQFSKINVSISSKEGI